MNRSEQISKLVKANRKRSRVRPLAWGSRGRKEGGDAFHDFSDSNNSSEIENDTKEARQNLKRARLQRRK